MNSHHKNGEKDTSLKDGLDKLGQAYGRLDHETPPDLLDQAILNRAHRAVEKKPHWMQFGWLHGLTTAAVFVLAFSMILNQREPVPDYENNVISDEPTVLINEKAAKSKAGFHAKELRMEVKEERDRAPDDIRTMEISAEKVRLGDTDFMTKSQEVGRVSEQADFMAVAEPAKTDMDIQAETESEAEQKLAKIIKLKQSGDESWKRELELFQEQFPDYPLPDGLKD